MEPNLTELEIAESQLVEAALKAMDSAPATAATPASEVISGDTSAPNVTMDGDQVIQGTVMQRVDEVGSANDNAQQVKNSEQQEDVDMKEPEKEVSTPIMMVSEKSITVDITADVEPEETQSTPTAPVTMNTLPIGSNPGNAVSITDAPSALSQAPERSAVPEPTTTNDDTGLPEQNDENDIISDKEIDKDVAPEETLTEIAQLIQAAEEESPPVENADQDEAQARQITVTEVETVTVSKTLVVESEPLQNQSIEQRILAPSSQVSESGLQIQASADTNVQDQANNTPSGIAAAIEPSMPAATEGVPSTSAQPALSPAITASSPTAHASLEAFQDAARASPQESLAPPSILASSGAPLRVNPARRPGPTPSSLAALRVSPGLSTAALEPVSDKEVSPPAPPTDRETTLPPPATSAKVQPVDSSLQALPAFALSLNQTSVQVPSSTIPGALGSPASTAVPRSADTLAPVDYTCGETDDAEGETDDGEGVELNISAEEKAMNGPQRDVGGLHSGTQNAVIGEQVLQDQAAGPSNVGPPRGTSKAPRGTAKGGPAKQLGPKRRIVEVVLNKLKRRGPGSRQPVPRDSVLFMLGIDVLEGQVKAPKVVKPRPAKAAPKVDQSRSSSSILPPPPALPDPVDDAMAGDMASSPPVPLYNLAQGLLAADDSDAQDPSLQQKTDRRHWNYNSDEGADMEHGSRQRRREKSTASPIDASMAVTQSTSLPGGSIHVQFDAAKENGLAGAIEPETRAEPESPAVNDAATGVEQGTITSVVVPATDRVAASALLAMSEQVPEVPLIDERMALDDVPESNEPAADAQPLSVTIQMEDQPMENVNADVALPAGEQNETENAAGPSLPVSQAGISSSAAKTLSTAGVDKTPETGGKRPRPRPKKAERELNEALLALATSPEPEAEGGNAEMSVEVTTQPTVHVEEDEATQTPVVLKKKPRKPKAAQPAQPVEPIVPVPEEPAEVPALIDEKVLSDPPPRRKLKMEHSWFDPDQLPTAVPYPLRYYLSTSDGQPIVSWREAEESGAESNKPQGTLYENGFRVNPDSKVDEPADRRANNACEWCRFSVEKCDGYGDRPCSNCCKSKRPVCVYKPWSIAEQTEYELDIEAGYKRSEVAETNGRGSRRLKRDPPAELELTPEDEKVVASMLTVEPGEIQLLPPQPEATSTPAVPAPQKRAKSKAKRARISAPASSPVPEPDAIATSLLEVVIDIPKDTDEQVVQKPSQRKRAPTNKAKRKKIQEPSPQVEDVVVAESSSKPNGVIPRRKMQKQQDWFDPDELPVSVPYTVRYYISAEDGQPIVSWRDSDAPGEQSQLPPGTLFTDGSIVNPEGFVDVSADRMAQHACEACRLSNSKCDGYGDRPCSKCMKSKMAVCIYKPWTEAEQREHQAATEYGTTSRRRQPNDDLDNLRKSAVTAEFQLTDKDNEIIRSMLTDYMPDVAALEAEIEATSEAFPEEHDVPPSPSMEVEVEIELPLHSPSPGRQPEEAVSPVFDAPWLSLHDAEESQFMDQPMSDHQPTPEPNARQEEDEAASPPPKYRKRKIGRIARADPEQGSERTEFVKPPLKKAKISSAQQEVIDVDTCFAGLTKQRTLKKAQGYFDPDVLPVSVPYAIRYYLFPQDGSPVVCSAAPEKPGRKSKRDPGTLFEDGSMVNPNGYVDPPEKRRANHACELCRFSATKCDGYGDRPCSACMRLHKPVCVYIPWTEADQSRYQEDQEVGVSPQVASSSRGSRRNPQLPVELQVTRHDQTVLQHMLQEKMSRTNRVDVEAEERIHMEPKASGRRKVRPSTPEAESSTQTAPVNGIHMGSLRSTRHSNKDAVEPSPAVALTQNSKRERLERLEKKRQGTRHEPIDVDTCFAGLIRRRKLKLVQDWFDPDALPVSVPYTMRYYLMPRDGQAVVSAASPEEEGVHSAQPEGTLYEDGNRVGPRGSVDAPATRRAKQPCEWCLINLQKCDGYGDRPCSACIKARKPICVYEPCPETEYLDYLQDLQQGVKKRNSGEVAQTRGQLPHAPVELQTTKQDRLVLEAMLKAIDEAPPGRRNQRAKVDVEPSTSQRSHKAKGKAWADSEMEMDEIDVIDDVIPEEPEQDSYRSIKRKKPSSMSARAMSRRPFDIDAASQGVNPQFEGTSNSADVWVSPVPRRKLNIPPEQFFVEDLLVSVPYPIRYYMTEEGEPVVSWHKPEADGVRSRRLVGTLYENGNRVNPKQLVDLPVDRRANHACEWCRFNFTKCDGYGDRPCTACCELARPVCVYRPWTTDDFHNYLVDIGETEEDPETTGKRRAFSSTKALPDLGTTPRDEIVMKSMLFASAADAGTPEYLEVVTKRVKPKKARESSRLPSTQSPTPASDSVEVDVPARALRAAKPSKRKPGWLPPQAGADSAWSQGVVSPTAAAGPSNTQDPDLLIDPQLLAMDMSKRSRSKGKGKDKVLDRVARPFRHGSSGTNGSTTQKQRSSTETVATFRKRRRIVSSTPELDPDVTDTLYAEMAYPESFERSRDWALFEDLLGIEDNEPVPDIDEAQYFREVTEDDGEVNWVTIRPTSGVRVVIELEKSSRWGPEPGAAAGPSRDRGAGSDADEQDAQLLGASKGLHMGKQIEVDASAVEDLLPTDH
ncbi:hypothetical protein QFC22_004993 [Naganishia vaughanmartiniae]|uniref:Uncharacterized protein n=1 Tax=Naganishia vaughanmartiniae TaxID=1424756 RepID=A0ACC2WWT0_9TREE|nr:hypothetical protein QFC22_004993 [Naganishia vaughanmartiniae]